MRNIQFGFGFLCLVLFNSCNKSQIMVSKKPEQNIVVNGLDDEWKNTLTYSKQAKVMYAISNDESNLYFCLKVSDEKLKKKIMVTGLTLWIDTTGKSKEKIGVKYPLGMRQKMGKGNPNLMSKNKPGEDKELKSEFLKKNSELEILGFSIIKDYGDDFVRIPAKSSTGFYAEVNFDSLGNFVYELKLANSLLYGNNQDVKGKVLGIKFRTGNVDIEDRESALGDKAIDRTQGGMSGNGMGGRGRPVNFGPPSVYNDPTELKFKVQLGN